MPADHSPAASRWDQPSRDDLVGLSDRAEREPLEVDISDYSDEFCAGFLAGQVNALELLLRRGYE